MAAGSVQILTPDQRLRVFVSSTLQELAPERAAACTAIEELQLTPVLFELGARPHPPQDLYRAYLDQSHVFIGIYWESYGWIAPGAEISGIEDEFLRAGDKPRLVYVKEPASGREQRLEGFLGRLRDQGTVSYKHFASFEELGRLIRSDLALLIAERFAQPAAAPEIAPHPKALPNQLTSFVGREAELARVEELLGGDARLVTLTGPGGIGKTRLAVEAAQRLSGSFREGAAFAPLESLASASLVVPAIASALGLRELGGDTLDALAAYLHGRELLLVLDNFEHVMEAAPTVASLLEGAPELKVLVTSRELLRLRGERELPVPPLPAAGEAVTLFAERAAGELSAEDLPVVAEICSRLDGMPLAIELAAPRTRLLTPAQLLERLTERLTLAGPRDAPERQQTLESAIAWSYELLDSTERQVFERLGVFRGGFSLDGAEAVCDLPNVVDLLGSLLDKSLVQRLPGAGGRLGMLSLIHEYACDRLDRSGERDAAFERFVDFYLARAGEWEVAMRTVGTDWVGPVDAEADNVRAIVARLVEQGRAAELARMIRGFWGWLWFRARIDEGRSWCREALDRAGELEPDDQGWMLLVDGSFAFFQFDFTVALAELREAGELFRATGDRLGSALALSISSMVAAASEGKERALADLAEALAVLDEADEPWGSALALSGASRVHSIFDDFDGAEELLDRTLSAAESLHDPFLILLALGNHGHYRLAIGDLEGARAVLERAFDLIRTTGIKYAADDLLDVYSQLEAARGEYEHAAELHGAAEGLRDAMRTPLWGPLLERQERFVARLEAELGREAFFSAVDRGRAHPLEQVARMNQTNSATSARVFFSSVGTTAPSAG